MPRELRVASAEEALDILLEQLPTLDTDDLEKVVLNAWASTRVKIGGDFHSEINGPFLEAYAKIDDEILRLFALARHGAPDIRLLKQDEIDEISFRVKVEDGSSEISDNLWKLAEKLSTELVGKMTGTELIITILGLALIAGTAWGVRGYLEGRKETRLDEIKSEERRDALAAVRYASDQQKAQFDRLTSLMSEQNQITKSALEGALSTNYHLLKASSLTDNVELSGTPLDRAEARELRSSPRRPATSKIVEQYMKVVDVNTADPAATAVIVEDPATGRQHRIRFRDRMLDARARTALFKACDARGSAWLRLSVKEVEDEVTSMEILAVSETQPVESNVHQIRPASD
ncbi:MAG: hypothetical protein MIN69_22150 [Methylorubrum extorquens]|jgi:hypothetical protein|uniref:hypothetical protein n=1 Tax=Methylobacteriaceae TaxID=119045 RepID=UPI0019D23CFB|nr:hypothetical protein [Methylobacterium organophilum]MBN6824114.1 hypothetical protein [Methylobacterium organophilum]